MSNAVPLPVLDAPPPLVADDAPAAAPSPVGEAGALLAELRRAPQAFGFFALMRQLEALHPDSPRFGRSIRPDQDPLRLGQEPSVTHAPASIADFQPGTDGNADRLLVHFFGLFGPDGPLPLHLTEYARDRRRNHADPTFQRFADLFHHRALSLFYRAWADARPTVSFDRPDEDRFSDYVGALIGLSTPGLRGRDAMPDLTKLHFAGLLSAQTRPAEGLGQILSAFFDMPVRVESFCGAWLGLPDSDCTRLGDGAETAELGKTALLGARVWSRQHKFRVVFGPLRLEEYERLLPGGLSFHRLVPIVRNYAGDMLIWDVNLILRVREVPAIRLGRQGRLGWTTWLMPRRSPTDAADLFLDASADSHASAILRAAEKTGAGSAVRMTEINRSHLFGKLNPVAYRSIEGATVFCKLRGNPYVELVHWLQQILQAQDSDLHRIVRHFEIDPSRLAADLTAALDKLPRGATAIADFAPQIEEAVERGWVFATLMFGASQIRTGHLLVGMVKTPTLRNALHGTSRQWQRIGADALTDAFDQIVGNSPEAAMTATDGAASPGEASQAMAPAAMGKQEALARFSVDLTQRAREGAIDAVTGRDKEIRQIVDVLMRRRQNNPILTGEAGVGKTAVVEGFALRIAQGDVPPMLREVSLRMLDVGLLQAGASMKGEFEQRLRQVIDEVQASPKPIILFIDEAHTLIGAGGAAGTGDAANLLKPALARGTLRTIAATTFSEYKKYFEKDPALTRRFQVVQVDEPDEEKAIVMMRGIATPLEQHHRVQILDEAIEAAVRLSHRYIPGRQLPDKSVSLLDTAAARVAVSQHATPPAVEDCQRRIAALEMERDIVARERALGIEAAERAAQIDEDLNRERETLAGLEERWGAERQMVEDILALRARLRDAAGKPQDDGAGRAEMLDQLRTRQAALSAHQGETPLILPSVDEQAVAAVVGDWTGIPVRRMVRNEAQAVLTLSDTLARRVIGQDHGLRMIARRVQTSRAGLDNPSRPVGVFMLCGPSGVGKTETALAVAEALYGGEQNLITINMSEFQEAHTVSTLKGAPPGYVGYGEGGVLTEAVRRKPYSVVLLDEVEKAHSDVHEIFFQVFDKGVMEDGEGRSIDFRNTLILLTSNVGTDLIMSMCRDPELMPDLEEVAKALRAPLLKVFPPALLGRLIVIPYLPLSDSVMEGIINLQLGRIAARISARHGVPFSYDREVVRVIASRCTEPESGGRVIDAILTNTLLPDISGALLRRLLAGEPVTRVHVGADGAEFTYSFSPEPASVT